MLKDREILRRKLKIRAWRRGMREMDILLGNYATRFIGEMNEEALTLFAHLLEENDQDLFEWIVGKKPPPPRFAHLIARICEASKEGGA